MSKIISGLSEFSTNFSNLIAETKEREQQGLKSIKSVVEEITLKADEANDAIQKVSNVSKLFYFKIKISRPDKELNIIFLIYDDIR